MINSFSHARLLLLIAAIGISSGVQAMAQSSSMLGDPEQRGPLRLSDTSYSYVEMEAPKELRIHDLVTVMVDESAQVISEGEIDRRKKADGKFTLSDWIIFDGLSVIPDPQSKGDPKITGKMENKYRAEGELETRESMRFRIACEIVDIRPNGTIVLEGRRFINPNLTVGVSVGYTAFYESTTEPLYFPSGAVSGEQYRSMNVFPLMVTGHVYSKAGGRIQTYIGLGLGVYYMKQLMDVGPGTVETNNWIMGFAPELGFILNKGSNTEIAVFGKYNYPANAGKYLGGESGSYQYLSVGLSFMGHR